MQQTINVRAIVIPFAALILFGLGYSTAVISPRVNSDSTGENLNCVAHGHICTGMNAGQALLRASAYLGGLDFIDCGIEPSNEGNVRNTMLLSEVIKRGCASNSYAVTFTSKRYLTLIWVKDDKVIRLDQTVAYDKGL